MVNSRRGRPTGRSDARERLLDAARTAFLERGYDATSVRSIAREAGVDHSLMNYYFGGKQGLYAAVMDVLIAPGTVLHRAVDADPANLAATILRSALWAWERPGVGDRLVRLLESSVDDPGRASFVGYLETELVGRLAEIIGGPDARRWAAGAASVMSGLFFTRYVLRLEPVASMTHDEVVRHLGPALLASLSRGRRR